MRQQTNISNPICSAVGRSALVKRALISDEYYRTIHTAALVEVQMAQGAVQSICYQQENSGWKAVVIPGPRILSGGTDFPRQRGAGELRMFSEISSSCRFTRSAQSRPKEWGKVLSSTVSSFLYWLWRGIHNRSGSWTGTGLPSWSWTN